MTATQSITAAPKNHFPQLDVLRGIAIFMVFGYHSMGAFIGMDRLPFNGVWRDLRSAPSRWMFVFYPFTWGAAGVALFFVLSGFVIHNSTLKSRQFTIKDFYRRRFWRIYPPYLLALVVFSLPHHQHDARQILSHLFLLHDFIPSAFYGINPAFWSLAVEFQLYLLYPALLWLRRRWGMGGALMFTLALEILIRLSAPAIGLRHAEWLNAIYLSPFILWFSWSLGAYLAEKYHREERIFAAKYAAFLLVIGCALFVAFSFYQPLDSMFFTTGSLVSLIAVEMYLWSRRPLNWIEQRLIPLGLCSYSAYLWHQPLMRVIGQVMHRLGAPNTAGANMLVCVPVAFLIIWGWSWALYRTVETWSASVARRAAPPRQAVAQA